jgi:hypothetical protein
MGLAAGVAGLILPILMLSGVSGRSTRAMVGLPLLLLLTGLGLTFRGAGQLVRSARQGEAGERVTEGRLADLVVLGGGLVALFSGMIVLIVVLALLRAVA